MTPCVLAKQVRGKYRRVAHRFVEDICNVRYEIGHPVFGKHLDVVLDTEMLSGHPGVACFVKAPLLERDRERAHRVPELAHVVRDGCRVEAATEEKAERHVGKQPELDRSTQEFIEARYRLILVPTPA